MDEMPPGQSPSDDLLRLLAAVPVSSAVLDLGCGGGHHTEPLLRLGFPVHACDPRPAAVRTTRARVGDLVEKDPETFVQVTSLDDLNDLDATFNWVVADRAEVYLSARGGLTRVLRTARKLLVPGGWLYLTIPATGEKASTPADREDGIQFTEADLENGRREAELALARDSTRTEGPSGPRWRALYRRVDPETPA